MKLPPITDDNTKTFESMMIPSISVHVSGVVSSVGLTHSGSTNDDIDRLHDISTATLATPETNCWSDFKDLSKWSTTSEAVISVVGRTFTRYINVLVASELQYKDPFTRLDMGNEQSHASLILSDSFSFRKVFTSVLYCTYGKMSIIIHVHVRHIYMYTCIWLHVHYNYFSCLHTLPLSQPTKGPALTWTNSVK